jgi:hypothetical protein
MAPQRWQGRAIPLALVAVVTSCAAGDLQIPAARIVGKGAASDSAASFITRQLTARGIRVAPSSSSSLNSSALSQDRGSQHVSDQAEQSWWVDNNATDVDFSSTEVLIVVEDRTDINMDG